MKTGAAEMYVLPSPRVFPESVGVDPLTGDAYVGSLVDGALYRLEDETELWSPAGHDGGHSVAGVKLDRDGRLFAAGGYEGALWIYDLADRECLARLDVGERPSCLNDIAFDDDGVAYVTDSLVPVLFRAREFTLEPWIDLAEQGVPWADGLNLNGVVVTRDGRHLVACQTNLGRFWRVALDTGRVDEVELDGGPLEHCDGLALAAAR